LNGQSRHMVSYSLIEGRDTHYSASPKFLFLSIVNKNNIVQASALSMNLACMALNN